MKSRNPLTGAGIDPPSATRGRGDSLDEWNSSRSQSASSSIYDALQPYPGQTMQRQVVQQPKVVPTVAAGVASRQAHDAFKGGHRARNQIAVHASAGHLASGDVGISPVQTTGFKPEQSPSARGHVAPDSIGNSEFGLVPAGYSKRDGQVGFEGTFGRAHAGKTNQSSIGDANSPSFLTDSRSGVGMPSKGRVRNHVGIDHIKVTEEGIISSKQDTGIGSTPLVFSPSDSISNDPSAFYNEAQGEGGEMFQGEEEEEEEEGGRLYPTPDPLILCPNSPSMASVNGSPIAGRRQQSGSVSGMKVSMDSPSAMTDHFSNSHHGLSAEVPGEKPRRAPVPHRPDSIVQGDKVGAMVAAGNKAPEPGYPVPRHSSMGGAHNASHLGSNFVAMGTEPTRSRPTVSISNRSHLGNSPALESPTRAAGIRINTQMKTAGSLSVSEGLNLQGDLKPTRRTSTSGQFATTHDATYGQFRPDSRSPAGAPAGSKFY